MDTSACLLLVHGVASARLLLLSLKSGVLLLVLLLTSTLVHKIRSTAFPELIIENREVVDLNRVRRGSGARSVLVEPAAGGEEEGDGGRRWARRASR